MAHSRWTLADVVDFEALLAAGVADAAAPAGVSGPRREVLLAWTRARKGDLSDPPPGEVLRSAWRTLAVIAALVGVLSGAALVAGLLVVPDGKPVNVAAFLAVTVGLQWLLLAVGLGLHLLRRVGVLGPFHPVAQAAASVAETGLRRLPGERRDRVRAVFATLLHRRELYGSLPLLPAGAVLQGFGIAFNVGLLAALLLNVTMRDLAFGWESTLDADPARVHAATELLASPWKFLPEATPTLADVQGSRFTPGQSLADRGAARAWWPFLAAAIVAYGLLPRCLLLGLTGLALRRALAALPFDHAPARALHRRLTGPLIAAGAEGPPLPEVETDRRPACRSAAEEMLLASDELPPRADARPVCIDHPSGNAAVLAEIAARRPESLAVAVPAARPPIKAIALSLERIFSAAPGADTRILLVNATPEALTHWRNFAARHRLDASVEPAP